MNVAFLNLAANNDWGGGEKWTLITAQGLAERGHSISVFGRRDSYVVKRAANAGLYSDWVPAGIDYAPGTILKMMRLLRSRKIDVLIGHHNKDIRTGGVAAKILGIGVIHRNGFPVIHNNSRHRFSCKFVNRILTNSQQIKEKYLGYGWMKDEIFDVVPNGIRKPETPPPDRSIWREWIADPKSLIAVFAGRLTTVKRVDDLLDAWAGLSPESHWHLVVIGAGHLEDHLCDRAMNPKLNGKVHLIGYRDNAGQLLGTANLVLLPSSEEGMPNTIMEAMSHGVPVAASPVGDTPYLLDNGVAGWIVPVGDVDGYTSLLKLLESAPEELRRKGKLGHERIVSEFSFERMIDGVEASILKLASL